MVRIAIFLVLNLMLAGPLVADQTDPRLNQLFLDLSEAPDPAAAQPVEHTIWQIWTTSESDAVNILMRKGIEAMEQRNFLGALNNFNQVVQIAPDFAEGWNKRATVHYMMGAYEDSLKDIRETLRLEPRHFGALSGRGLVMMQLDRTDDALSAFEAALKVHPQMPGARLNAEILRKLLKDRSI